MKLKNFDLLGYRVMGWLADKKELSDFQEYNKAVQIALNILHQLPEDIQAELVKTDFLTVKEKEKTKS
tara:strand:+ start:1231 stop:1434 length:204 start_codon:yes stop_codon:yes gene_type:complete